MDFLQQWSAEIFKCAAGTELNIAYDVYAMTEVTTKYLLRQLEFRIQRLFNCFLHGDYKMRCRFLQFAEEDFRKLVDKLDELQMYYDIKTKRGRVNTYRIERRKRNERDEKEKQQDLEAVLEYEKSLNALSDKCIPYGFPDTQMMSSLKSCFYFPEVF